MSSFFEVIVRDPNQFHKKLNKLPQSVYKKVMKDIDHLRLFPNLPHLKSLVMAIFG